MGSKRKSLKQKFKRRGGSRHPLGGADADAENELADYFVGFDRLVEPIKNDLPGLFIHLGSKGSGKSAIQRVLEAQSGSVEQKIIVLRPKDMELWRLSKATDLPNIEGISTEWLYKGLWTYLIAVQVFRQEYDRGITFIDRLRKVWNKDIEAILDLLDSGLDRDRVLSLAEGFRELLLILKLEVTIKEAVKLKLSAEDAGSRAAARPQRNKEFLSLLRSLVDRSPELLSKKYLLLIDDLDSEWSNTPAHRQLLEGLVAALRSLAQIPSYSFVVAMRRDIYSTLQPRDRDKIRQSIIDLRWSASDLLALIEARIGWAMHGAQSAGDVHEAFEIGACEEICQAAVGNPRKAIEIAEECILQCIANGQTETVGHDLVRDVIEKLSIEFLRDLDSQYHHTYPGLLKVASCFRGLRAEFPYDEMELVCVQIAEHESKLKNCDWAMALRDDPHAVAHLLATIGLLRYKAGRDSPSEPFVEGKHEIDAGCWLSVARPYRAAVGVH